MLPEIYYQLALHIAFLMPESRVPSNRTRTLIARSKFISQKNNKGISQHENSCVGETLANPLQLAFAAPWLLIALL